jgi:type II secretory pathway pseudopilin PulG
MLKCARGLSLIETLMAVVILGAALISISYFFSQGRANIEAFGRTRSGLALAQEKMESLKDLEYAHADLTQNTHSDRVDASGQPAADGVFFRRWIITPVADPANGVGEAMDYKLVDLRVYDQRLNPDSGQLDDPVKRVAHLTSYISP